MYNNISYKKDDFLYYNIMSYPTKEEIKIIVRDTPYSYLTENFDTARFDIKCANEQNQSGPKVEYLKTFIAIAGKKLGYSKREITQIINSNNRRNNSSDENTAFKSYENTMF